MREVLPTVVPYSLGDVVALRERYRSFLTAFHVDAADGEFAPNKTWIPSSGERLPDADKIFYSAHLMVQHPFSPGLAFREAGCRGLEAHAEVFLSVEEGLSVFSAWRKAGIEKVGLALLLQTSLDTVLPYLGAIDYVRLMTIPRIGTQGIPFDASSIARVADFHVRYASMPIAIDGGVSEENIQALAKAGAMFFTAGSAISKSPDPQATYERLVSLANGV